MIFSPQFSSFTEELRSHPVSSGDPACERGLPGQTFPSRTWRPVFAAPAEKPSPAPRLALRALEATPKGRSGQTGSPEEKSESTSLLKSSLPMPKSLHHAARGGAKSLEHLPGGHFVPAASRRPADQSGLLYSEPEDKSRFSQKPAERGQVPFSFLLFSGPFPGSGGGLPRAAAADPRQGGPARPPQSGAGPALDVSAPGGQGTPRAPAAGSGRRAWGPGSPPGYLGVFARHWGPWCCPRAAPECDALEGAWPGGLRALPGPSLPNRRLGQERGRPCSEQGLARILRAPGAHLAGLRLAQGPGLLG